MEPMMEAVYMHMWSPHQALVRGDGAPPSLDPVSCISLFQKTIVITGLTDVRRAIATVT
jgi:hypothetical protein